MIWRWQLFGANIRPMICVRRRGGRKTAGRRGVCWRSPWCSTARAEARAGGMDRQTLRDSGFSEKDIWDIANVAGFYNMTNRVASAVDMQPNKEYHCAHRTAPTEN